MREGGEKVARTLCGRPGSCFHLAVDANGAPLDVRLAAGNDNERRHLVPLLDALAARGIRPSELWADRAPTPRSTVRSASARSSRESANAAAQANRSQPANRPAESDAAAADRLKTPDPLARNRWPVERTNALLKAKRRIATRRDRTARNYLAFLHLGMILILTKPL